MDGAERSFYSRSRIVGSMYPLDYVPIYLLSVQRIYDSSTA